MNEKTMKWIVAYTPDANGTVKATGYECSMCGYFTRRKSPVCPFCKRREEEPCEDKQS
jgi:rubrerythrin